MRAFVFGAVLVACSSGGTGQVSAQHSAGAAGAEVAGAPSEPSEPSEPSGGSEVAGSGGAAPARVCDPGRSESCTCGDGATGAQVCAADGQSWEVCACESTGGSSGAPAGGAPAMGGAASAGSAGAVAAAGSGGSATDPLDPFPTPGCPEFTTYRVPPGKWLAITGHKDGGGGEFTLRSVKMGQCVEIANPVYDQCVTVTNPATGGPCACTVTSPPSCGQYCDGEYGLATIMAKPGNTFTAALSDGTGACVNGVPTKTGGA